MMNFSSCCSHETNRLIEGTKQNIETSGCIGGEITITKDAPFLKERLELYNQYYEAYKQSILGMFCLGCNTKSDIL